MAKDCALYACPVLFGIGKTSVVEGVNEGAGVKESVHV